MVQKFFQNLQAKDTYEAIKRRHDEFEQQKKGLNQRVSTVRSGLENCGLKVTPLGTKELIELYYNIYNPTVARYEKAKQVDQIKISTDEERIATETK